MRVKLKKSYKREVKKEVERPVKVKIEYRFANPEDVDQLARLRTLMQVEIHQPSDKSSIDEFTQKVKNYFLKSLTQNKFHSSVAVFENKIIANAGVVFYERPPSIKGGTGLVGYVTNVYTEKPFRGRGIGTQLVRELTVLALKLQVDKLHLGATPDGMRIYKSVGYEDPQFYNLELREPFNKVSKGE